MDFFEWPERFAAKPEASNGIVRQDVRGETKAPKGKVVALEFVKGYVVC